MTSLSSALAVAAASGFDPDPALTGSLLATYPDAATEAASPPSGQPYSRRTLHRDDIVEIMLARWAPAAACAPHDHGGAGGFVVVLTGSLTEIDYTWDGDDLIAGEGIPRPAGSSRGFGPEVIHAMRASACGAVTLHVYSPQPERMNVYDLDRRLVLDLVGDFGAWIPDGEHPGTPFSLAAPVSAGSRS